VKKSIQLLRADSASRAGDRSGKQDEIMEQACRGG
jgi:hypothetical protein